MSNDQQDWRVFRGRPRQDGETRPEIPDPPPWRSFSPLSREKLGERFVIRQAEIDIVNAALFLRRPLLVTGRPGTGKTTLAYAVAKELGLGDVLLWPITTRTTIQDGLYRYDAVGRLQDVALERSTREQRPAATVATTSGIGRYLRLGPLGTALYESKQKPGKPRVLLIDEIDKSDIDLPNDLLHVFEEGTFTIPELERLALQDGHEEETSRVAMPVIVQTSEGLPATIVRGRVECKEFPFVVLTSNGERDFPPAFLRRCLRLDIPEPDEEALKAIIEARLEITLEQVEPINDLIQEFIQRRDQEHQNLATDQLLNAIFLAFSNAHRDTAPQVLRDAIFRSLDG